MRRAALLTALAAACSLLLLESGIIGTSAQTVTLSDFETGSWSYSDTWPNIKQTCSGDCPVAVATGRVTSAEKHSGAYSLMMNVTTTGLQGWYVQVKSRNANLTAGNAYIFCLWVKSNSARTLSASMDLLQVGTYSWATSSDVTITSVWSQHCQYLTKAPVKSGTTEYFWGLNLGTVANNTVYWVDDLTLTTHPLDAGWYGSSQARIDTLRRGRFSLHILGANGQPTGAVTSLSINQTKHGFPWGTALTPDSVTSDKLAQYNKLAGRLFSAFVPENKFKWPSYEPCKGCVANQKAQLDNLYFPLARDNHMVLARGHTLEWFIDSYNYPNHWSRLDGCTQYLAYLEQRIKRDVAANAGKFNAYDVINELLHETSYPDQCNWWGHRTGPNSTIVKMFKWAREADPAAQLCINEYEVIEGDRWPEYVAQVRQLIADGAPIDCIGAQAHMNPLNNPPEAVKYRLDRLAEVGLPIYITEVSVYSGWSEPLTNTLTEAESAEGLEQLMTTFFSHPAVKGVLFWGFWDGAHWIANAGFYRQDFTPKLSGQKLEELLFTRWWTRVSAATPTIGAAGNFTFTGFYGRYDYSFVVGGKTYNGTAAFPTAGGAAQAVTIATTYGATDPCLNHACNSPPTCRTSVGATCSAVGGLPVCAYPRVANGTQCGPLATDVCFAGSCTSPCAGKCLSAACCTCSVAFTATAATCPCTYRSKSTKCGTLSTEYCNGAGTCTNVCGPAACPAKLCYSVACSLTSTFTAKCTYTKRAVGTVCTVNGVAGKCDSRARCK